jgi:aspartyl/asparaginyl-tRNA synthetase
LELNRSQSNPDDRYKKVYHAVKDIDESLIGHEVLVRGRLHTSRAQGKKIVFIVLREQFATI